MSSLGTVVELEAVHTCMHSNPVEFDGIENWIVEALPDAQEFYSAPVPKPVAHHIIRVVRVLELGDVRRQMKSWPSCGTTEIIAP